MKLHGYKTGVQVQITIYLKKAIAAIECIKAWWMERVREHFAAKPFSLRYDAAKNLQAIIQDLLAQAKKRQQASSGTMYQGAMLQHLVGAKLELALPDVTIEHNGFSVADAVSDRSGDFMIDDAIIHCTTAPTEALLQKCKANLQSGKRPIILTISKMIGAAEGAAESLGIDGRVEIMDALQFLAANLYKMSLFKAAQRKITIEKLVEKYNEIVSEHESDASLRIDLG